MSVAIYTLSGASLLNVSVFPAITLGHGAVLEGWRGLDLIAYPLVRLVGGWKLDVDTGESGSLTSSSEMADRPELSLSLDLILSSRMHGSQGVSMVV